MGSRSRRDRAINKKWVNGQVRNAPTKQASRMGSVSEDQTCGEARSRSVVEPQVCLWWREE